MVQVEECLGRLFRKLSCAIAKTGRKSQTAIYCKQNYRTQSLALAFMTCLCNTTTLFFEESTSGFYGKYLRLIPLKIRRKKWPKSGRLSPNEESANRQQSFRVLEFQSRLLVDSLLKVQSTLGDFRENFGELQFFAMLVQTRRAVRRVRGPLRVPQHHAPHYRCSVFRCK